MIALNLPPRVPPPATRNEKIVTCASATGALLIALLGSLAPLFSASSPIAQGLNDLKAKPGVALPVLLLGLAILALQLLTGNSRGRWVALLLSILAGLGSLVQCLGQGVPGAFSAQPHSGIQQVLVHLSGAPWLTGLLALSAWLLLCLIMGWDRHRHLRLILLFTSVLLSMGFGGLALGLQSGVPLWASGSGETPGVSEFLSLCILNFSLASASGLRRFAHHFFLGEETGPLEASPAEARRKQQALLLVFFGVNALLILGAYSYIKLHVHQARHDLGRNLTTITQLKLTQLGTWKREREADAATLMKAPFLAENLPQDAPEPERTLRFEQLRSFFDEYRKRYGYSQVTLYDASLRRQADWPELAGIGSPPPGVLALMQGLDQAREPRIGRVEVEESGKPVFNLLVPLFQGRERRFAGAVDLKADAQRLLQGLLSNPGAATGPASLLVKSEGRQLFVMDGGKARMAAERAPRLSAPPLNSIEWQAAIEGSFSLREGHTQAGLPVLAVAERLGNGPWVMLTLLPHEEAYQLVREEALRVAIAFAVLMVLIGLVLGRLWRQHLRDIKERQDWVEQDRLAAVERLGHVMRNANDIVLHLDENLHIIEANEKASMVYGWSVEELKRLTVFDIREQSPANTLPPHFVDTIDEKGKVFESLHRTREGRVFPVEVSTRRVLVDGRKHILSIIRDITQRKAHEREIERLTRMYHLMSELNKVIIHAKSRTNLLNEICRVLVEYGRFRIAWVGWPNAGTKMLEPIACAGDEHNYVPDIRIPANPADPEARGPSGITFTTGRTYVCNDFFSDPHTVPWREQAKRCGFQASISLPLRQEGMTVGLLMVYATEAHFFGSREIALLEEAAGNVSFALEVVAGENRRREMEGALRSSQERLAFLLTATPAIIYSTQAGGEYNTTFISENVREVLGYEPQSFLEDPGFWIENLHPEDRDRAQEALGELDSRSTVTREYRFRHRNGSYRWMHDVARLTRDNSGRPMEMVGYWIDVTEGRVMQSNLSESEGRYRLIAENTSDVIWLFDMVAGCFTYVSPSVHKLRGYTPEEVLGQTMQEVMSPAAMEKVSLQIAESLAALSSGDDAARHTVTEVEQTCKNGGTVLTEVVTTLLLTPQGQLTQILGVSRDITQRKRMELELQDLLRGLKAWHEVSLVFERQERQPDELVAEAVQYLLPALQFPEDGQAIIDYNGKSHAAGVPGSLSEQLSADIVVRQQIAGRVTIGYVKPHLAVADPASRQQQQALVEGIARTIGTGLGLRITFEELRQSEERARALFENADVGMFEMSLQGEIRRGNRRLAVMLSCAPSELRELRLRELIQADFHGLLESLLKRLRERSQRTLTMELRCVDREGSAFWGSLTLTAEFSQEGQPCSCIGVLQDISQEVAAHQTLQSFNTELEKKVALRTEELAVRNREVQALLQSIPDMVLRMRKDGTLLHCQQAHGNSELAALGASITGDPQGFGRSMLFLPGMEVGKRALEQNTTVAQEAELTLETGPLSIELRAAPVGTTDFVLFVRDITDRKRLEQEMENTLRKEREISAMKGRFISVTSHEFRTPMAAALGSVDLLLNHMDRLQPSKRAELIGRIGGSLGRMNAMLDDLLSVNRVESGRIKVHLADLDLGTFMVDLLDEIRAGDRGAHPFVLEDSTGGLKVRTDTHVLRHCVSNLLTNAARYSPAGTPVTLALAGGEHGFSVCVSDQGIGVPPAEHARIFEPFERGSNVGEIRGTGLGLNIVKRMGELLGARIQVESPARGGARFTLHFPLPPPTHPAT